MARRRLFHVWYHARSGADSRGSDLPCADRAWSSMISHVEQVLFFLSRVVHVKVKPVGGTDSDDWWQWVTRALPYWRQVKQSWANKKEKKRTCRWKILSKPATCEFTPFLPRCRVACKPERHASDATQESGRQCYVAKKNAKMTLRPLWLLHRTRRWLATSCDRYCRTANQRSLIVKKTLFKYATSFHEMENFPWCASPRAFQR